MADSCQMLHRARAGQNYTTKSFIHKSDCCQVITDKTRIYVMKSAKPQDEENNKIKERLCRQTEKRTFLN